MDDYETNKKKHGLVGLIGLVWCGIWIWVLSTEIAYMNKNYIAPAGTVASTLSQKSATATVFMLMAQRRRVAHKAFCRKELKSMSHIISACNYDTVWQFSS